MSCCFFACLLLNVVQSNSRSYSMYCESLFVIIIILKIQLYNFSFIIESISTLAILIHNHHKKCDNLLYIYRLQCSEVNTALKVASIIPLFLNNKVLTQTIDSHEVSSCTVTSIIIR